MFFSKDAVYLHSFRQVEYALAQDETILDRLSVGKVALNDELATLNRIIHFREARITTRRARWFWAGSKD